MLFSTAGEKSSELVETQTELQKTLADLSEAKQTVASYTEIESEWRSHSEKQEEKVQEMGEIITQHEQDLSEAITAKEQLLTQLQEKSE